MVEKVAGKKIEKKDDARELIIQANELMVSGKFERALPILDKALKLKPDREDLWLTKADALSSIGRHREAIECCDQALKIKPDYDDAHYHKGFALCALGKYEESLPCFDEALRIDPGFSNALAYKGIALTHLRRDDEAISFYKQALEKDPDNVLMLANLGSLLSSQPEHLIDALPYLKRALDLQPNNPGLLIIIVQALDKIGRFDESEMLLNRLARLIEKEDGQSKKDSSGLPPISQ